MKFNYLIIPALIFLVAYLGGTFTTSNLEWYSDISLPFFTPKDSVFGIAWTIIFILSAIAALIAWNQGYSGKNFKTTLAILLLVNAGLNLFWSYLFFESHLMGVAFFEAMLLSLSVIALIVFLWKKRIWAAILLIPYAGWAIFASVLNYAIWKLN